MKKGFTLIEILAVIALLGIVMFLVTPNLIKLFTGAKKSAFYDEALNLYGNAYTTYIYNSSNGDYNKRFCKGKDTQGTLLEVEDKRDLYYDITVNSYGEVTDFKISNKDFGLTLSNSSGLSKKDINQNVIAESFDINCDGAPTPPSESLVCIITKDIRYCNVFGFQYERALEDI